MALTLSVPQFRITHPKTRVKIKNGVGVYDIVSEAKIAFEEATKAYKATLSLSCSKKQMAGLTERQQQVLGRSAFAVERAQTPRVQLSIHSVKNVLVIKSRIRHA